MATLEIDSASMCIKECVIKSEQDLAPEIKKKNLFFWFACLDANIAKKKYGEKSLLELIDCTCWLF